MKLCVLFSLIFLILSTNCIFAEPLKKDDKVPEIKVQDMDGNPKSLSDFKGKILIIDFWATWCNPCIKEFPHFEKFYKNYKDKGIEFIAISVDNKLDKVKSFVKKNNYSFTILHDLAHETSKNFKIGKLPTLFIVSPDGYVKDDPIEGGKRKIDKLLEEKIKDLFDIL